jgi:hypothetical protein
VNAGAFAGRDAGVSARSRICENINFFLSGGIGAATSGGSPVGCAGFMYVW